jgi:polyisoprenoid-binding protein YceI
VTTATATAPAVQTHSTWQIDPAHSLVEFSVRHMMVSTVKGRFTSITGTILDNGEDPTLSSVQVEIDPASITTADPKRDGHLRSPDFFDVEQFPKISFKSTRIQGNRDQFKLIGDLTIRDQTREVALDVTLNGVGLSPYGQTVAGFSGQTKFNRRDFGLNWNAALESGGVLVSDQIKLEVEIEAVKQAA